MPHRTSAPLRPPRTGLQLNPDRRPQGLCKPQSQRGGPGTTLLSTNKISLF